MSGILKITLIKSMIGKPEKHRRILRGLGLTRLNKTVELADTPSTRGMVRHVCHLVKAEEKVA